ncbi:6122_t:CDS:2 [Acaulospora colombiana]|uniref:6122_t:CDS:1 n=1 Tax=Acaulospora colombiana TaxID=27376 RepID=A0ACA9NPG3_9GLOM|nr:6122_t:CDS:2 [Acaulospora colombiana]
MANLQRHPSLRFSVFEVAHDIGLENRVLDGNFDPITEEDESTPSPLRQRQTHSSDELTDSPYPRTPPSSNDVRERRCLEQKMCDSDISIEQPLSLTPKPTTPRTPPVKLKKLHHTPTGNSPGTDFHLDFATDVERKFKKKGLKEDLNLDKDWVAIAQPDKKIKELSLPSRDHTRSTPPMSPPEEEEKKLLGGLFRFRTKSRERKAAAKQAVQQVALEPSRSSPVPRVHTPPPLPIAGKFARATEDVSFRPQVRESGSSHGGGTSVGHGSNTSTDTHDVYPRPRDRSSRYERPHPVWRNGPSSFGHYRSSPSRDTEEKVLPEERHAFPPNQTIFDREPARLARVNEKEEKSNRIDMDAVNKYYGITPTTKSSSPAVSPERLPQSPVTKPLTLSKLESQRSLEKIPPVQMEPARNTPSPLPNVAPSPHPERSQSPVQPREPRGRMRIPPALDASKLPPKRLNGAFYPPPTPPPTTELPPIPQQLTVPAEAPALLSPGTPSAMRSIPPSPLGMRSPSPNLRATPSPAGLLSPEDAGRPGLVPQEGNRPVSPMRSASPMLRGKMPAFPSRPITPTRQPPTPSPQPHQEQPEVYHRPNHSQPERNTSRGPSFEREPYLRPIRSEQQMPPPSNRFFSPLFAQGSEPLERTSTEANPPVRKRSVRRTNNQSGYDSDDAESRFSRDTYYGRDTAYFDDSNLPPLPGSVPPVPNRDFGDMEDERKAGRERLVRMLTSQRI